MIVRPMLAGKAPKNFEDINFPVIASPKLDGIRCLFPEDEPVTRNFKPIPNKHISSVLSLLKLRGFDGEIIVPDKTFNEIQSTVMSFEGLDYFEYHVFDYVNSSGLKASFQARIQNLRNLAFKLPRYVKIVEQLIMTNEVELSNYENHCLEKGYEGVMIRDPFSPYKCGRSTTKEGFLLKIKRFSEDEARVCGFIELLHNNNPKTDDAFGLAERSSCQENKIGMDKLGSLVVNWNGLKFQIGTGFTDGQRISIWRNRSHFYNQILTFKYQKSGSKDKPRFPVFKCFRKDI